MTPSPLMSERERILEPRPLHAVPPPDLEASPRNEIVRRESVFRWALAVADVVAATLALVACVTLGNDGLTPFALLALPLMMS